MTPASREIASPYHMQLTYVGLMQEEIDMSPEWKPLINQVYQCVQYTIRNANYFVPICNRYG